MFYAENNRYIVFENGSYQKDRIKLPVTEINDIDLTTHSYFFAKLH